MWRVSRQVCLVRATAGRPFSTRYPAGMRSARRWRKTQAASPRRYLAARAAVGDVGKTGFRDQRPEVSGQRDGETTGRGGWTEWMAADTAAATQRAWPRLGKAVG